MDQAFVDEGVAHLRNTKVPLPRTLHSADTYSPTVVLGKSAVPHERGIPVIQATITGNTQRVHRVNVDASRRMLSL